jgi:hypothetical protein
MLERAILQTVLYADIFNFPLTLPELERFLIGEAASLETIRACLSGSAYLQTRLTTQGDLICLRGREDLFEERRRQQPIVEQQWKAARRWGRALQLVPFLKAAIVTGSLAAGSAKPKDDIDFLLLVEPGRLWACRAMVIGVVRLARLSGVELCPNYLMATKEDTLAIPQRNLYTARELTGMRLLFGKTEYDRLIALNCWAVEWLPNSANVARSATPLLGKDRPGRPGQALKWAGEKVLGGWLGEKFERWEQRKIARLNRPDAKETSFTVDLCKGHFGNYANTTLAAFARRCAIIEAIPIMAQPHTSKLL